MNQASPVKFRCYMLLLFLTPILFSLFDGGKEGTVARLISLVLTATLAFAFLLQDFGIAIKADSSRLEFPKGTGLSVMALLGAVACLPLQLLLG